jgi:hypothetical protein
MMDRMFEQSQKLMNDNLSFWTAQATQATERLMSQGDAALKQGGAWASNAVKEQTALLETLGKHLTGLAQQQASLFTGAFKPAA